MNMMISYQELVRTFPNTGPQFAEMVIWERLLTTDEINSVANYASDKYSL